MTGLIDELTHWFGHGETIRAERFAARDVTLNGAAVAIRSGAASDVAATVPMIERICALHRQWDAAKFGFVEDAVPMYRNWLAQRVRDPRSVFVVAAANGRLVAFAIGTTEEAAPIFRPARYGLIRDLWVENEWRRHGVGRQILRAAIDQFRAMGIMQIRLETAAANDAGRRFFASVGFRSSAIEMLIE